MAGMACELLAVRSQCHAVRQALEKRHPQFCLQGKHAIGDCGLRDMLVGRRSREAA